LCSLVLYEPCQQQQPAEPTVNPSQSELGWQHPWTAKNTLSNVQ